MSDDNGTATKPPIVVCIPWLKAVPKHMDHFIEWYAFNKPIHNLKLARRFYKATHQVQHMALRLARTFKASHILFTEDDQWGYPIDGLDVLLEADKDVIGYRTYFKAYPFLSMAMRKIDPALSMIELHKNFVQIEGVGHDDPVQKVDLITWAFTLVKMSVFDRMSAADKNPFDHWGPHPTDSFFCQYCEDLGIDRWCHFGFTIAHGEVPPEDIPFHRLMSEAKTVHHNVLQKQQITLEDDHGHLYGNADYTNEMADQIKAHFK